MNNPIVQDSIRNWHAANAADGRRSNVMRTSGPIEIAKSADPDRKNERIVLLRNDSLFVIPIITDNRGDLHTLLTTEYRCGAARETTQFPAESTETGESLIHAAWRAFGEETTIQKEWVTDIQLLDLGEHNYASPGSTNEQLWYARADVTLPPDTDISLLHERICGLAEHGEKITTSVHALRRELFSTLNNAADKLALLLVLEELEKSTIK